MMRNGTSINNRRAGAKRIAALCLTFALAFAVMLGLLAGPMSGTAEAASYNDTASHWARDAIDRWSGYGVLQGVSATRFEPDRSITRAEFLAVINRAFGATAAAGISNFRDVPADSWFYSEIARAVRMGTTNGTSGTTMSPNAAITRQEAVVVLARALGIYADGYQTLQTFNDASRVAPYARTHVSAFVDLGYISGSGGYIYPTNPLSRAEAVTILDNIISGVSSTSETLSSPRSTLIRTPGTTYSGTVGGDLIIADGVGTGEITLQNLTVRGRLVIRGGGSNSVKLTGVTVLGGTFVQNPNGATRIVLTNSSVGNLTARTGVILEGSGASAVTVPAGLTSRVAVSLSGADADAVSLASPADVKLLSGTVDNVYFLPGSAGSTFDIASGAKVSSMSINAQNITVTGAGELGDVTINASGANIAMSPKAYHIGDNLSAVIAGVTRYGRATGQTVSNVSRQNTSLYVTQNAARTGGTGLSFNTVSAEDGNSVNVTQTANSRIPLSTVRGRLAYWVGVFIPNPGDGTGNVSVTYSFDGAATAQSVAQTTKDGRRGIEIMLPVTRYDDGTTRGALDDEIFISWGSGQYETMWIRSGALELATPTVEEEAVLVGYFRNAVFYAYNGTAYTGSEAIRRLLASDNALGLSRQGFTALAESGMNNVAIRLNGERSLLTSRKAIQERLIVALAGEGAFFAINRALTAEQVKGIIELRDFGYQIGISDMDMSKYYTLSQAGRLSVAKTVLLSRGTDYKTEEDLAKVFLAAVDSVRQTEVTLLTNINATRTSDELRKLLENKTNNLLLDIVTDGEPYKSLDNDKKVYIMATMFEQKPFSGLDDIHDLFISLVGIPAVPPSETEKVTGVSVDATTITIEIGAKATIDATVVTSTGTNDAVSYTVDKANIAMVDSSGTVTGSAKGSAKVTVASSQDPTKKATVTVTVVEPKPAETITLSRTTIEVGEGGEVSLIATLTPSGSTSLVQWGSDDNSLVSITPSKDGKSAIIKGLKPGITNISARVEKESLSTSCAVTVVSKEKGVAVYPSSVTVGIGTSKQVKAVVSPIELTNRRVTWKSSDSSIAKVDANGVVTGVSTLGQETASTTITATSISDPAFSASCTVTVDPTLRAITLSKSEIVLYLGGMETIEATIVPLGSEDTVDWSWDNTWSKDYVEHDYVFENNVQQSNKVTLLGKKAGTFILMASLPDGVYAECKVTVLSSTVTVTPSPKSMTMNVGDTAYVSAAFKPDSIENKKITWWSGDKDIVTIDPVYGTVKAVWKGGKDSTVVKVYGTPEANKNLTIECTITVKAIAVKSIRLVPTAMTLKKGEQRQINAIIDPDDATGKILWTTENEDFVSLPVDGEGYITGRNTTWVTTNEPVLDENGEPVLIPGTTEPLMQEVKTNHPITVTATIGGKSATCIVTVSEDSYQEVQTVEIGLDTWVFPVGFSQSLRLTFNMGYDDPPADRKVQWTSSDSEIASVDASGYMICHNPGVVTINVITEDGAASDSKKVVVANVGLSSLKLTGLDNDYTKGKWVQMNTSSSRQVQITATPTNTNATDKRLTWVSSDENIVKVNANGLLTAQNPGWAKITISPTQLTCYGTALPGAAEVIMDTGPDLPANQYKGSGLYTEGSDTSLVYYSPNYQVINIDGTRDRIKVDATKPIPLVVKNEITDKSNEFWVFVAPASGSTAHSVSLSAPDAEIATGDSVMLTAQLNWGNSVTPNGVEWSITPDNNGLELISGQTVTASSRATASFKGVVPGEYTVTVSVKVPKILGVPTVATGDAPTLQNDAHPLTATYKITVSNIAVESVAITGATPGTVVYKDETLQLSAQFTPANASAQTVTWFSDNTDAFTVSSTGLVTAVAPGAANIRATTTNGKTAEIMLIARERQPLARLILSVTDTSIEEIVGKFELTVAPDPASALTGTLTWTSANPGIAAVTGTGNLSRTIIGVGAGETTITVTAPGGITASCLVTVTPGTVTGAKFKIEIEQPDGTAAQAPPLEGVKLRSTATAVVGGQLTLTPYVTPFDASKADLKWESANTAVATVDNGVVVGLKAGSAKITVSDGGKIKATCTVTVKASDSKPVTSISISKKTLTINVGKSSTLSVSYKPSTATVKGVTWTSSDETVARVEPTGKVIGVSGGKATITATSDSGAFTATCEVTVNVPVKSVTISDKAVTLKIGETFKLGATTDPAGATNQSATWKSSSSGVAAVAADGTVTAKKAGTATITVTIDGKKATCKVTVVK